MAEEVPAENEGKIPFTSRNGSYTKAVFRMLKSSAVKTVFKGIVLLLFLSAFVYQVITFLNYVFEYPTVVTTDIISPEKYLTPAFTFCSSVKISREKYCVKYPDRCIVADDEFCDKYKGYCSILNITVKKEYLLELNETDLDELEYNLLDILVHPRDIKDTRYWDTGALPRISYSYKTISNCYSYASVTEEQKEPIYEFQRNIFEIGKGSSKLIHLRDFVFKPPEMFQADIPAGIFFTVHSQFDASNPFLSGHFFRPGKSYRINVEMKEERRLPPPYKTNCTDYIKLWLENGKSGPRSKKMCQLKCEANYYTNCLNCSKRSIIYPSKLKPCSEKDSVRKLSPECQRMSRGTIYDCFKDCKEECQETIYTYTILEKPLQLSFYSSAVSKLSYTKDSSLIYVDVHINDKEITHLEFSPKYEKVEIFSYIGGFLGIWLGVSFVQATDFIHSLFHIGWEFFKKKKQNSSTHNV
ncbi:degenerin mec-10-like [Parasteatoda tepidariorum]|uniref:degenerin mec-10-like n=1 Tax=Parasteatoda tepidariorum TaxID=114398 RepID=UPI001C72251F|nr:degenerin mec-10-like [Parasteatoda tepidariorum]